MIIVLNLGVAVSWMLSLRPLTPVSGTDHVPVCLFEAVKLVLSYSRTWLASLHPARSWLAKSGTSWTHISGASLNQLDNLVPLSGMIDSMLCFEGWRACSCCRLSRAFECQACDVWVRFVQFERSVGKRRLSSTKSHNTVRIISQLLRRRWLAST